MAELCNQSELHANQMTECKKQLLAHAADAFEAGSKPVRVVDLVPLQAKIGQLALGNDCLESALTKAGSLSAKLSSRPRSQTACYPTGQTAQSQPRLCALPAQAGKCCRSGTLMRRTGIEALAPQPGTSKATPGNKIYPYLLRKLAIVRANRVWALDTTFIPMARGFVYLSAVVDVAGRRVLTHKVAIMLEACHGVEIIEKALARFGLPEIVNTRGIDQGLQELSMGGHSAKYERICLKTYDGLAAARVDIADYFNWYNTKRPHSSLDRITPQQTYLNWLLKLAEAAQKELSGAPRAPLAISPESA